MRLRWLILALLAGRLFAQASADNFPCYNSGSPTSGNKYNASGTQNGSGDNIYCTCGIPAGTSSYPITGSPVGNVAALQAYSNDAYTPDLVSSRMPQRSMDWCAAYGNTTIVNSAPDIIYLPGGGNYHISTNSLWANAGSQAGGKPGFVFVAADPNQNASTKGANVVVMSYETSAYTSLENTQTSGATTLCVAEAGSRVWPTDAEVIAYNTAGTPISVQVEGEIEVVTNSQIGQAGCNTEPTGSHLLTVTRSAGVAHNTTGVVIYVTDFTGKNTEDASVYDAVTMMNAIACNGWGNRHDIRLVGGSNGGWIAGQLAGMSLIDKVTYRLAANNEYTCANVDDWQAYDYMYLSPPNWEDSTSTLSADSTEPAGNAVHFGRGSSGLINTTKSLSDSGCTVNNTTACVLGACTATGLTPAGTLTSWALNARQKSPMANKAGNVPGTCSAYNSCPGLFHTPIVAPLQGLAIGNADQNVDGGTGNLVGSACYTTTYGIPYTIASDCNGGSCAHENCETQGTNYTSWYTPSTCVTAALKQLAVPDTTYGSVLSITTASLPNGTVGTSYTKSLASSGGTGGITWTAYKLPVGLSQSGGTISGTPSFVGTVTIEIAAQDSATPPNVALTSLSLTIVPQNTLDSYGGYTAVSFGGGTGYFYTAKRNGRWTLVDPLGNGFWYKGIQNVNYTNITAGGSDVWPGGTALMKARYPDSPPDSNFNSNAFFNHVAQRMKGSWDMNAMGLYVNTNATAQNPAMSANKMPYVIIINAGSNSLNHPANCGSYANQIIMLTDTVLGGGSSGGMLSSTIGGLLAYSPQNVHPDVYDPMWQDCAVASYKDACYNGTDCSVSANKTDPYLLGFGADMDYTPFERGQGPLYAHLGVLIAFSNPCSVAGNGTASYCSGTHKNYTKAAWSNYLLAEYGNIGALNTAWQTSNYYTTFTSSGTNTWGTGTGILDEDGSQSHSWVGGASPNLYTPNGTAAFNADVNAFLALYAQTAEAVKTYAVRTYGTDANHLILSTENLGGKNNEPCDNPPRAQVVKGMQNAGVQVFIGCWSPSATAAPVTVNKAIYDDLVANTGGALILVWTTASAEADSDMNQNYCNLPPPSGNGAFVGVGGAAPCQSNTTDYALQAGTSTTGRGGAIADATHGIPAILNVKGSNGDYPLGGIDWWELNETDPEHTNFGFTSNFDNAYDGQCAVIAGGQDSYGYSCGGEYANFGNFTWQAQSALISVDNFYIAAMANVTTGGSQLTGGAEISGGAQLK